MNILKISTKNLILVALFTALTVVGGFLKFSVGTVPITLQFLFTALAGVMLGSKLGALSQIVYVLIGLIGIPVFTVGGGIGYVFHYTFGFVIGFIIAAYVIGKIIENSNKVSFKSILVASLVGLAILYLIGVPYFYMIFNVVLHKGINFDTAMKLSMIPFLPGDIIKCIIVAFIGAKALPAIKTKYL